MLPKIEKFSIQQVLKVLKERWNTATALWDNNERLRHIVISIETLPNQENLCKRKQQSCWYRKLNVYCITVLPKIHESQTVDPQAEYTPWSMMKKMACTHLRAIFSYNFMIFSSFLIGLRWSLCFIYLSSRCISQSYEYRQKTDAKK